MLHAFFSMCNRQFQTQGKVFQFLSIQFSSVVFSSFKGIINPLLSFKYFVLDGPVRETPVAMGTFLKVSNWFAGDVPCTVDDDSDFFFYLFACEWNDVVIAFPRLMNMGGFAGAFREGYLVERNTEVDLLMEFYLFNVKCPWIFTDFYLISFSWKFITVITYTP